MDNFFTTCLMQLLPQLPVLLTLCIGLVLGLILLQRSGLGGSLVLAGATLSLLLHIAGPFLYQWMARYQFEAYKSHSETAWVMAAVNFCMSLAYAVCLLLFFSAALVGRGPRLAPTDSPLKERDSREW